MNQSYARVNAPHSRARNVFGVQLYKNNVCALLLRILSIVNSDWLQHACSVHRVYELVVFAAVLIGKVFIFQLCVSW